MKIRALKLDGLYIDASSGTLRNSCFTQNPMMLLWLYFSDTTTFGERLIIVYNSPKATNKGVIGVSERAFFTLEGTRLYHRSDEIVSAIRTMLEPLLGPEF